MSNFPLMRFSGISFVKNEELSIEKNDDEQDVTAIKYVYFKNQWRLVITLYNGCRVYSENGSRLLTYIEVPESNTKFYGESGFDNYFMGITSITMKKGNEAICVGNSLGEVHFIENSKENYFSNAVAVKIKGETAVTSLASSKAYSLLFVGDALGHVHMFQFETLKDYKLLKTIDLENGSNPVNAMAMLEKSDASVDPLLVTADFVGRLKIFNVLTYSCLVEVNAHARTITALDTSSEELAVLSASEDTYLHVWKLSVEKNQKTKLNLVESYNCDDQMIMGAVISSTKPFDVAFLAYDSETIRVLNGVAL